MLANAARITLLLALAGVLGATAAPQQSSSPQSNNEVRKENDQLRAEVRMLRQELEAAQQRIAELETRIDELLRELAAARAGGRSAPPPATQPAPPKITVDESVPNASPRALRRALEASYREATAELEPGEVGDRDRIAYLRALHVWARRVNRDLRSQISWHVRIVSRPRQGQPQHELVAVDPETDVPLGDPFGVVLSRQVAQRLAQREERGGRAEVLVLKGVISPNVAVNPSRSTAGAFDRPRFIGPYAEYEQHVAIQSLVPVTKSEK